MNYSKEEFCKLFDNTLLKPTATTADFHTFCAQAAEYGFCAIAVNTGMVKLCSELLTGSGVKVDAAVSFPLGITTIDCKVQETLEAIHNGAREVDYVMNIGKLKEHDYAYLREEMYVINQVCREHGVLTKAIFENHYLTDDEKRAACEIALEVRPDFIKTSTGFAPTSATVADVKLMKQMVGDLVKVKAAGGVRTLADAFAMLEAGADRIGCSNSAAICDAYSEWISK